MSVTVVPSPPRGSGIHSWTCPAPHDHRVALDPGVYDASERHLPKIRMVPSGSSVHRCALLPEHGSSTILVPLAVPLPESVMHLPGTPPSISPAGSVHLARSVDSPVATPGQSPSSTWVPFLTLSPGSDTQSPDPVPVSWPK